MMKHRIQQFTIVLTILSLAAAAVSGCAHQSQDAAGSAGGGNAGTKSGAAPTNSPNKGYTPIPVKYGVQEDSSKS